MIIIYFTLCITFNVQENKLNIKLVFMKSCVEIYWEISEVKKFTNFDLQNYTVSTCKNYMHVYRVYSVHVKLLWQDWLKFLRFWQYLPKINIKYWKKDKNWDIFNKARNVENINSILFLYSSYTWCNARQWRTFCKWSFGHYMGLLY